MLPDLTTRGLSVYDLAAQQGNEEALSLLEGQAKA